MKPMTDRKMDMGRGEPESFFPDSPHKRALKRPGEIRGFDYPDTEQDVERDQEQQIKATSASLPKPDFRH